MADPDHVAQLDGFDRATVLLYRLGLGATAASLAGSATLYALRAAQMWPPAWMTPIALVLVCVSVGLAATHVHLYVKHLRWFLLASTVLGMGLALVGLALPALHPASWPLLVAGVGFTLVTASGLAWKERFCFRIPGLGLSPLLLAAGVFLVLADLPVGVAATWGPAALILGWLAVRKALQPLHFDIGDKARYQV
jgi:uncharacterized integral membrane protein